MEKMKKTCAVCGNQDNLISTERILDKQNHEKAHLLSNLMEQDVETCYNCNYCSFDISTASDQIKGFVNSDKYQTLLDDERFDFWEELENPEDICAKLLCGVICEKNKDYLSAAKMMFLTSEDLFGAIGMFKTSLKMEYGNTTTKEEKEIIDEAHRAADGILGTAKSLIEKHLETNPKDIDAMIVKLLILKSMNVADFDSFYKVVLSKKLTSNQLKIIEYLS